MPLRVVDAQTGCTVFPIPPSSSDAPAASPPPQPGGEPVLLGRLHIPPETAQSIPRIDGISRAHFSLQMLGGGGDGVELRDNNSTNGVLVNNRRVAAATLAAGDRLVIGGARKVKMGSVAAPGELVSA
jgi:hypothetical protein